jgi:hypothetical protein
MNVYFESWTKRVKIHAGHRKYKVFLILQQNWFHLPRMTYCGIKYVPVVRK